MKPSDCIDDLFPELKVSKDVFFQYLRGFYGDVLKDVKIIIEKWHKSVYT